MATDPAAKKASGSKRVGEIGRMSRAQRRRRYTVFAAAAAAVLVLLGTLIWVFTAKPLQNLVVREACTASYDGQTYTLTPEQAHYAALITAVSAERELPVRAGTVAVSTALQESRLKNLDYGDTAGPDSRGLFQQRSSQGWGTEAQIMDPLYAANAFYDGLEKVSGWEKMSITAAAQSVQRSAYPEAYAQHENTARAFVSALRGQAHQALVCELRPAEGAGVPNTILTQLKSEMGVSGSVRGRTAWVPSSSEEQAWAVAQWAVAQASALKVESVSVNGLQWTRSSKGWEKVTPADGVQRNTVLITAAS